MPICKFTVVDYSSSEHYYEYNNSKTVHRVGFDSYASKIKKLCFVSASSVLCLVLSLTLQHCSRCDSIVYIALNEKCIVFRFVRYRRSKFVSQVGEITIFWRHIFTFLFFSNFTNNFLSLSYWYIFTYNFSVVTIWYYPKKKLFPIY